jgi:hypothetical protein
MRIGVAIVDTLQAAYGAFIHTITAFLLYPLYRHTVGRLFRNNIAEAATDQNKDSVAAAVAAAAAAAQDSQQADQPQPPQQLQQQQQQEAAINSRMSSNYNVRREMPMTFEECWAKIKPLVSIISLCHVLKCVVASVMLSLSLSGCSLLISHIFLSYISGLYVFAGRGKAASQVGSGHEDWSLEYEIVYSS